MQTRLARHGVALVLSMLPAVVVAQGTAADYARAAQLGQRFQSLMVGTAEQPTWVDSSRLWYRRTVQGGSEFVLVDAARGQKRPAFDHARLATVLSTALNGRYTATTLPFTTFTLTAGDRAIAFVANGANWECTLAEYTCANRGPVLDAAGGRGGRGGAGRGGGGRGRGGAPLAEPVHDPDEEPLPNEGPWIEDDGAEAEVFAQRARAARQQVPGFQQADTASELSPDRTMEAYIQNYNVWVRGARSEGGGGGGGGGGGRGAGGRGGRGGGAGGGGGAAPPAGFQLSWDGSEGSPYTLSTLQWSPDSRKIAVYRVTPGYQRIVRFIESSPTDQLQPKYREQVYQKPGDAVTKREPVLFDITSRTQFKVNDALFPNAYSMSGIQWWDDSRGFTFEYNQRGHQAYRVIEVNAQTGEARAIISEESRTFISYRPAADNLSEPGARLRRNLNDGREIIWMSERDGWKHLYLYDGVTGRVKNQITRGEYVVRNIQRVDTVRRQIYFSAGGMNRGQDPYFTHYYRVNFDGTGLVAYTSEDGTHTISWSPDDAYYVDSWQRVDLAPVTVVKRASDQRVTAELERGDVSALVGQGFQVAEPFVAKGRDGTTDIYGVIFRPTNFDPSKKYAVIEQIYAGPQGSFVPKTFSTAGAQRTLAEHGFIVVQIDGMGTTNRSKAFHDVAWKNLGDAGFADRILWHKAVAAKYPWYDISRVGIYGTSAGGQNAMGALVFHPEFYKAAFAAAGCHDNRMDKMWWNEQWMGWPIGPHYAASSNMENAHRLEGNLLLAVGELDTNVDPSSTLQVVNALIRANKTFDLLYLPGQGHTNGGAYGVRKMTDFFVHHLIGAEPPHRNAVVEPSNGGGRGG